MTRLGRSYPVQRIWKPPVKAAPAGIVFDAVGAGSAPISAVTSISWSHTAASGAYVLVSCGSFSGFSLSSVKYGTFTMTQLASVAEFNNGQQYLYGLSGAPGGAQTVTVTGSGSDNYAGNSVSYTGVSSAGTAQTTAPTTATTSLTQSVTCTAGQMIVQSFQDWESLAITGYSGGTGRSLLLLNGASGRGVVTLSDATVSTTFTATDSSSVNYSGAAVVLS